MSKRRYGLSLSLLTILCSSAPMTTAQAQNLLAGAVPLVDPMIINPGHRAYPPALSSAGVQGRVLLELTLTEQGRVGATLLKESSRSKELDQIALDVVKTLSFKQEDPAHPLSTVQMPVLFQKDTRTSLMKKTCADFNTDLRYFNTTFAGQTVEQMPSLHFALGLWSMLDKPAPGAIKSIKNIVATTLARCAAQPEKLFFETLQQTGAEFGSKP